MKLSLSDPPSIKEEESINQQFWKAVSDQNVNKVIALLNQVDINWRNEGEINRTPLHVAVEKGNSILVALLLGSGADVAARDANGKSPLTVALETTNQDIISLLAERSISSLEETKIHLQMADYSAQERTQFRRMKQLHSHIVRPDNSEIDGAVLNSDMDKIITPPKQLSIFQDHFPRKSPITTMMQITHFQTIYNIFVAVFMISLVNTLLANFIEVGQPLNFDLLFWTFGKFPHAFGFWAFLVFCAHSVYFLQKGIITGFLSPALAYMIYAVELIGMFSVLPIWVRTWYDYPPATSAFVTAEAVRLTMKAHSYLMVNRALRIAKANKEDDPSVREYPNNVTLWNFFEYLWLPTLVYQTSYPRTTTRRWGFVVKRFGEVGLCILYIYAVWVRYCAPSVKEMQTADHAALLLGIFKVMMPGIAVSLLGFYLLLHSWLNAFAEMTRFADRHFYSDWWNATNWAHYYRKWNYVVHHFIHRHIFMEGMVLFNLSKNVAMGLTFLISAIIHEYVIAVSLGFYKPIMFLMFLFPGVMFIPLTGYYKGNRGWNVFMWAMLIIGHGMLVGLYARAWHFHYSGYPHTWLSYIWIV